MNKRLLQASLLITTAMAAPWLTAPALAAETAGNGTVAADASASSGKNDGPIGNADDIVVTATIVNESTPITASVHTSEPQSIISRSIIEDSVAPTDDFMDVVSLTPGAITSTLGNGPGFGDAKVNLRGFSDGKYNVTFDGIPFGDSNDPTHHSTAYFPDGTYERIIVDRGPGYATDLGQASYGGNIHIVSREAADKFFVEGLGTYGTANSQLERLTVNTGKIGNFKLIAVGEHKKTDGLLTALPGEWWNGFAKAEWDISSKAKLTLIGTYNHSILYQEDGSKGASCYTSTVITPTPAEVDPTKCDPASQIGTYGINYHGLEVAQAGSSLWPAARRDWNWQDKATDFEVARLQWDISDSISLDNKAYTYFYKNFTFESDDPSTPCVGAVTAATCASQKVFLTSVPSGKVTPGGIPVPTSGPATAGDIPGRTKLNQYRQSGDILQLNWKTGIGTAKVGFWYEHSTSKRYGYDYDVTKLAAAGGVSYDYFNFAIANSGPYFNNKEADVRKDGTFALMANGQPVPLYIKYDERTSWDQYQGFGEFEFKLLNDALTVTPGVKIQNFTRKINTPIAAQTSREGIVAKQSYKPTLPYFTVNYLINPGFSVYAQYAKGFLIPALSASLEAVTTTGGNTIPQNPLPTRTTNYQAGFVYSAERFNIDGDVYYIKASNSTYTDPAQPGVLNQTASPATYQGVEAQASFVVTKGLTLLANGSLGNAKDDVTGLWLPNAPNHTALLGAVYRLGGFKLSYLHKWTGEQWANAANTFQLPGYSSGTLSASYNWDRVTVGLTVNNVWDDRSTTAIALGSGLSSVGTFYQFQSPRTVEGSVKFKF